MGRRDSDRSAASLPVDQYRKQIGKHLYKKDKEVVKEIKRLHDSKQSALGVKDVLIALGAIFAVFLAIYGLFYYYLTKDENMKHTTAR